MDKEKQKRPTYLLRLAHHLDTISFEELEKMVNEHPDQHLLLLELIYRKKHHLH
jgi:hypothetical protein